MNHEIPLLNLVLHPEKPIDTLQATLDRVAMATPELAEKLIVWLTSAGDIAQSLIGPDLFLDLARAVNSLRVTIGQQDKERPGRAGSSVNERSLTARGQVLHGGGGILDESEQFSASYLQFWKGSFWWIQIKQLLRPGATHFTLQVQFAGSRSNSFTVRSSTA